MRKCCWVSSYIYTINNLHYCWSTAEKLDTSNPSFMRLESKIITTQFKKLICFLWVNLVGVTKERTQMKSISNKLQKRLKHTWERLWCHQASGKMTHHQTDWCYSLLKFSYYSVAAHTVMGRSVLQPQSAKGQLHLCDDVTVMLTVTAIF